MWESAAVWLHPAMGIIVMLMVILTRRDLMDAVSRRQRAWRAIMPLLIVISGLFQVMFILRGIFEIQDLTGVPSSIFGAVSCLSALILYIGYVRRWMADDKTVLGR